MAVTGGPDSNSRFVCKGATGRGSRRKSSGLGGRATVSLAAWLQSESLTSIRLARIELWCLEQVEEDAASKPGPWLRILFATS